MVVVVVVVVMFAVTSFYARSTNSQDSLFENGTFEPITFIVAWPNPVSSQTKRTYVLIFLKTTCMDGCAISPMDLMC
jgi:hypothetical protein